MGVREGVTILIWGYAEGYNPELGVREFQKVENPWSTEIGPRVIAKTRHITELCELIFVLSLEKHNNLFIVILASISCVLITCSIVIKDEIN